MKGVTIERKVLYLKEGERIELADASEQARAYTAARGFKLAGVIDFEITCFRTKNGFVAIRKPK